MVTMKMMTMTTRELTTVSTAVVVELVVLAASLNKNLVGVFVVVVVAVLNLVMIL